MKSIEKYLFGILAVSLWLSPVGAAQGQTSPTLEYADAVALVIDSETTTGTLAKVVVAGSLLEMSGHNFWQALSDSVTSIDGIDYAGELVVRRYIATRLVARPIRESGPEVLGLLTNPATGWATLGGDPGRIGTDFETARAALAALVEGYAVLVLEETRSALAALAEE